jgi:hypothetical protein
MRRSLIASMLVLAAVVLGAVTTVTLVAEPARAQGQDQVPLPPGGFKPLPAAPVKPYKAVAVILPATYDDPSFVAFRKQLDEAVQKRNRAALGKLVVAQGFFWVQDKDVADKHKSGIDNLAKAIDLDAKDGSGWDVLAGYSDEATAAQLPDHPGVICAPAGPTIDPKTFGALIEATQTAPSEWGYPVQDGTEVHSAGQASSPVIEKLGLTLVRVLPDSAPPENANQPPFLHVATPSGKAGFVLADAISGLGGDQICYLKDAGGWKITGYFGGAGE